MTMEPKTKVKYLFQGVAVDSDATDSDEDPDIVPAQNWPGPPAEPQPEESLIESPIMSESELENSVDRRDIYRRSMVKSIAGRIIIIINMLILSHLFGIE